MLFSDVRVGQTLRWENSPKSYTVVALGLKCHFLRDDSDGREFLQSSFNEASIMVPRIKKWSYCWYSPRISSWCCSTFEDKETAKSSREIVKEGYPVTDIVYTEYNDPRH